MMAMTSLGDKNFQLHYNLLGPPSYMQSLVDQNVVIWCMTSKTMSFNVLIVNFKDFFLTSNYNYFYFLINISADTVFKNICDKILSELFSFDPVIL